MAEKNGAAVERLYVRLAEALRNGRGFAAPVTVAEIYQELVPYRLVRSDVGFGMNADYEDALLRLLAGEGGYIRLDPPHASQELRRELDSTNPNLAAYREFAGCDAWVSAPGDTLHGAAATGEDEDTLAWLDDVAGPDADDADDDWEDLAGLAATGDEAADPVVGVSTFAFVEPPAAAPAQRAAERAPEPAPERAPEPAAAAEEPVHCVFCDSTLPAHRAVRFCPFCGADQRTRPCGACGETVEPGWAYCVACGASRE